MAEDLRIGFIGAGNMATALATAIHRKHVELGHGEVRLFACAPSDKNLKIWRERFNCHTTHSVDDLITKFRCDVLMICVKPKILTKGILIDLRNYSFEHMARDLKPFHVISTAAGVTMEQLKKSIPSNKSHYIKYYRIMTSIACSLSQSTTGIFRDPLNEWSEEDERIKSLCSWFGSKTCVDSEDLLHALVGVSGSGLGFCFEFIQALSDGGVSCGLSRDQATIAAAQTLIGAGMMVLNTGNHPIQLRDMVCSPGGTTIAGIHAMDQRCVRLGIREAVEVAAKRSREFSNYSQ